MALDVVRDQVILDLRRRLDEERNYRWRIEAGNRFLIHEVNTGRQNLERANNEIADLQQLLISNTRGLEAYVSASNLSYLEQSLGRVRRHNRSLQDVNDRLMAELRNQIPQHFHQYARARGYEIATAEEVQELIEQNNLANALESLATAYTALEERYELLLEEQRRDQFNRMLKLLLTLDI